MSKKQQADKPIDASVEYIHNGLSLRDLVAKYKGRRGFSLTALEHRCKKEKWVERQRQYRDKVTAETERLAIGTTAEMNARHIERAMKIQDVTYQQIISGLIENPVSAHRMALDSERLARGEVTDRTGDEFPPSLEELDKDSLREIGNIVARARAKRAKEPGVQ